MCYATEQGILNEQMNVQIMAIGNEILKSQLMIVSSLHAKFSKDGDQYFYIIGDLPEPDCIVGFGDTPMLALNEFCKAYGLKY